MEEEEEEEEDPLQLLLQIPTTVLFYTNFRFIDHCVYNIMITFAIFEELAILIFLDYLSNNYSSFLTFFRLYCCILYLDINVLYSQTVALIY